MENSNKRIVKNTLLLYFRMLLTLVVSLYTVRVVLATLGVIDYGINNVVGGVVTMFAFLSNTMASASQRFFAFEIGQDNHVKLKKIFSVSLSIYAIICIIVLIFAETLGLWFLNHKVVLPENRMVAANWVYQFSIFSFMLTMFAIPYNALIMAHEKMRFYAYVSIVEVVLKLLVVFSLVFFTFDKLKLYAGLTFGVTLLITLVYIGYCVTKFKESKFSLEWDKQLFKEISAYSSWSLFGATTGVLNNQGLNLMLNLFFGPIINTGRGIAYQVNTAVSSFVNNLFNAVNPQIIKSYAENDLKRQTQLIIYSTKIAYALLLILSLPLLIDTAYILKLWLGDRIDFHMVLFTRLVLIFSLVNVFESPISQAVRSTGKIKDYQLYVGILTLLILPFSYIALKLGAGPESPFYIMIIVYVIAMFVRLNVLRSLMYFPVRYYLIHVFFKLLFITILTAIIPILVKMLFKEDSFIAFISVGLTSSLSVLAIFYFLMLDGSEKDKLKGYILSMKGAKQ